MCTLSCIGGFGRIFGVITAAAFLSAGGLRYGGGFFYGYLFIITAIVISCTAIIIIFTISDSDLIFRYEGFVPENNSNPSQNSEEITKSNNKISFDSKFFYIFLIVLIFVNFGRNGVNLIQDFFLIAKFKVTDVELGEFETLRAIFSIIAGFSTPLLIK